MGKICVSLVLSLLYATVLSGCGRFRSRPRANPDANTLPNLSNSESDQSDKRRTAAREARASRTLGPSTEPRSAELSHDGSEEDDFSKHARLRNILSSASASGGIENEVAWQGDMFMFRDGSVMSYEKAESMERRIADQKVPIFTGGEVVNYEQDETAAIGDSPIRICLNDEEFDDFRNRVNDDTGDYAQDHFRPKKNSYNRCVVDGDKRGVDYAQMKFASIYTPANLHRLNFAVGDKLCHGEPDCDQIVEVTKLAAGDSPDVNVRTDTGDILKLRDRELIGYRILDYDQIRRTVHAHCEVLVFTKKVGNLQLLDFLDGEENARDTIFRGSGPRSGPMQFVIIKMFLQGQAIKFAKMKPRRNPIPEESKSDDDVYFFPIQSHSDLLYPQVFSRSELALKKQQIDDATKFQFRKKPCLPSWHTFELEDYTVVELATITNFASSFYMALFQGLDRLRLPQSTIQYNILDLVESGYIDGRDRNSEIESALSKKGLVEQNRFLSNVLRSDGEILRNYLQAKAKEEHEFPIKFLHDEEDLSELLTDFKRAESEIRLFSENESPCLKEIMIAAYLLRVQIWWYDLSPVPQSEQNFYDERRRNSERTGRIVFHRAPFKKIVPTDSEPIVIAIGSRFGLDGEIFSLLTPVKEAKKMFGKIPSEVKNDQKYRVAYRSYFHGMHVREKQTKRLGLIYDFWSNRASNLVDVIFDNLNAAGVQFPTAAVPVSVPRDSLEIAQVDDGLLACLTPFRDDF